MAKHQPKWKTRKY